MNTLDLKIFVETAQIGSLSAAARRLNISPAVASAAIKRLETELNCILLIRSTRNLRLTSHGEAYLRYCENILQLLDEGRGALTQGQLKARGELRITAPTDFGHQYIVPWLDELQSEHPQLTIHLQLSDGISNFYRENIDAAIRYSDVHDTSLVATTLCPNNRRVLCAAPSYLAQHGLPTQINELHQHNCLRFTRADEVYQDWRYTENNTEKSIAITGNRTSTNGDIVRQWALAGHGIAYKSHIDIAQDVRANRLHTFWHDTFREPAPLYFVYANRRNLTHNIRLLRDFLQEKCMALNTDVI